MAEQNTGLFDVILIQTCNTCRQYYGGLQILGKDTARLISNLDKKDVSLFIRKTSPPYQNILIMKVDCNLVSKSVSFFHHEHSAVQVSLHCMILR